jgi:PIN domain nuclease of toxin-antitoxin system
MVRLVEDPANEVWVSALSIWECRIKQAKGKLFLPPNLGQIITESGFLDLPFNALHAEETATLPPIHADPFDRGLLAQARCEGFTLLTSDRRLAEYGAPVMYVG